MATRDSQHTPTQIFVPALVPRNSHRNGHEVCHEVFPTSLQPKFSFPLLYPRNLKMRSAPAIAHTLTKNLGQKNCPALVPRIRHPSSYVMQGDLIALCVASFFSANNPHLEQYRHERINFVSEWVPTLFFPLSSRNFLTSLTFVHVIRFLRSHLLDHVLDEGDCSVYLRSLEAVHIEGFSLFYVLLQVLLCRGLH